MRESRTSGSVRGMPCKGHIYSTEMEMPIPYCIYTKVQKEKVVWTVEARCTGDNKYIVQVQRSRDHRRGSVHRSCTFVCKHPTEDEYLKFYGISEREEYANDI